MGYNPNQPYIKPAKVDAKLRQMWDDFVSAVAAPGNAANGKYRLMVDQMTGENYYDGMAQDATGLAGLLTLGSGAIPAEAGALRMGLKAYHGSPHSFDKFDMGKIGTGQGNQSFGHGLYFAENEGVAKSYRDVLAKPTVKDQSGAFDGSLLGPDGGVDPRSYAMSMIQTYRGDVDAALAAMKAKKPDRDGISESTKTAWRAAKWLEENRNKVSVTPNGSMYAVDIKADPKDFLDWDAPLNDQPEAVKKLIKEMSDFRGETGADIWASIVKRKNAEGAFGEHIADPNPAIMTGPKAATNQLRAAGIPGIRYLDASSRKDTPNPMRNYVVFDDKLVDIVKKYGLAPGAVGAAAGGAGLLSQDPRAGTIGA